jgi:putative endonuclease
VVGLSLKIRVTFCRQRAKIKSVIPAQAGIHFFPYEPAHERKLLRLHSIQLSSQRRGTLYVGVTSDLPKRVYEHKNGMVEGFTKRYGVHRLVYYEVAKDAEAALTRESQIKKWNRAWKLRLIEEHNPEWEELYANLGM